MAFKKTGTPEDAQLDVLDREEAQRRIAERLPESDSDSDSDQTERED